jgi:hypothetical protein
MRALFTLAFALALSAFQGPPPDSGPVSEEEKTVCFPMIGCFEI